MLLFAGLHPGAAAAAAIARARLVHRSHHGHMYQRRHHLLLLTLWVCHRSYIQVVPQQQ
jgi:hypothetical protein